MVHHRPSTGCSKCRQRHIKCDEARPACQRCTLRGLTCPGYRDYGGVVFKDQTRAVIERQVISAAKAQVSSLARARTNNSTSPGLGPYHRMDQLHACICFFFHHFVQSRENHPSISRGHLDFIIPLYASAPPTSALALSTLTLATSATQIHHRNGPRFGGQDELKLAACQALQAAVLDPFENLRDETLLAVICLDLAEQFASVAAEETTRVHVQGALALVKHRGIQNYSSPVSLALLAATRSNVLLQNLWFDDEKSLDAVSAVPDLETTGSNPAVELQRILKRVLVLNRKVLASETLKFPQGISTMFSQADGLSHQLRDWHEHLPASWVSVAKCGIEGKDRNDTSIEDVLSTHIAYVMGEWHCTTLMLLKLRYALNRRCEASVQTLSAAQGLIGGAVSTVGAIISLLAWLQQDVIPDRGEDRLRSQIDGTYANSKTLAYNQGFMYQGNRPSRDWYMYNIVKWAIATLSEELEETAGFTVLPAQLRVLHEEQARLTRIFRSAD